MSGWEISTDSLGRHFRKPATPTPRNCSRCGQPHQTAACPVMRPTPRTPDEPSYVVDGKVQTGRVGVADLRDVLRTPDEAALVHRRVVTGVDPEHGESASCPACQEVWPCTFWRGAAWQRAQAPSVEDIAAVLETHEVRYSSLAEQDKCTACGGLTPEFTAHYEGIQARSRAHQAQQIAALYGGEEGA